MTSLVRLEATKITQSHGEGIQKTKDKGLVYNFLLPSRINVAEIRLGLCVLTKL